MLVDERDYSLDTAPEGLCVHNSPVGYSINRSNLSKFSELTSSCLDKETLTLEPKGYTAIGTARLAEVTCRMHANGQEVARRPL